MPKRSRPEPQALDTPQSVREAALRLLARREHSRRELERKLEARGAEGGVLGAVIEELAAEGLQSDGRYCEVHVRGRFERGYGPRRIRAELREHGLEAALIEQACAEYATRWVERAAAVYERKYAGLPAADATERARRQRFLEQRGFTAEQIRAVLRGKRE